MRRWHPHTTALMVAATTAVAASNAAAETPAEQASRLRIAVDGLAQQLQTQQRTAQDELAALTSERAELQRQIRLERTRAGTLAHLEAAEAQTISGEDERLRALRVLIQQAIAATQAYVRRTLPFKREARLHALGQIASDLAGSHPDLPQALGRLWRFLEEEEALGQDVSQAQQPIQLGESRQLVEVVRIGMALLYFRTPDFRTRAGEVGWARQTGGTWRFEVLSDHAAVQTIQSLFAALAGNTVLGPQRLLIPEDLR